MIINSDILRNSNNFGEILCFVASLFCCLQWRGTCTPDQFSLSTCQPNPSVQYVPLTGKISPRGGSLASTNSSPTVRDLRGANQVPFHVKNWPITAQRSIHQLVSLVNKKKVFNNAKIKNEILKMSNVRKRQYRLV